MAQHIMDFCEDKARKGDGQYAVAFAVLQLAGAQERTASALERLGLADAATPMGAIELLSAGINRGAEEISQALGGIADAVSNWEPAP